MLLAFSRSVAVVVAVLSLTGCSTRAESYRYKLTLAVNTPGGVARASSVVEVLFRAVAVPARGVMHQIRGEALYLDLGLGRRPLIALLTKQIHPNAKDVRWSRDGGPNTTLLARRYDAEVSDDLLDRIAIVSRLRGAREVGPADLPDLATFSDVSDPSSVMEVDPSDLQATLGPNISWNQITLEVTDEPISRGIERKLPWLPAYRSKMLDGAPYQNKNTLANTLSTAAFTQTSDLKSN
jgi:hypothetical protein